MVGATCPQNLSKQEPDFGRRPTGLSGWWRMIGGSREAETGCASKGTRFPQFKQTKLAEHHERQLQHLIQVRDPRKLLYY